MDRSRWRPIGIYSAIPAHLQSMPDQSHKLPVSYGRPTFNSSLTHWLRSFFLLHFAGHEVNFL